MLRALEVRNFRMLANNYVSVHNFQVLVGQNASGKSTFFGALQLLSDVLRAGTAALFHLSRNFFDLCFVPEQPIALAVEVVVDDATGQSARYEIELGLGALGASSGRGLHIIRENLYLLPLSYQPGQKSLYGAAAAERTMMHDQAPRGWRKVVSKNTDGRDFFIDEQEGISRPWRVGPERSALAHLPDLPEQFRLALRVRDLLRDGIQTLELDVRKIRSASPPGLPLRMLMDGSNLPYVVRDLKERDPILFRQWVQHVATGVASLESVDVVERPEDRHIYLTARFSGEHREPVPAWLLSDGTLRLMALTLLSYAATPNQQSIYLIEEPENGLHPLAIQAAYDALSEPLIGTQVFFATHSPILLSHVPLNKALVFRRAPEGYAIARHGPEIPEFVDWRDRTSLADMFAVGVLS